MLKMYLVAIAGALHMHSIISFHAAWHTCMLLSILALSVNWRSFSFCHRSRETEFQCFMAVSLIIKVIMNVIVTKDLLKLVPGEIWHRRLIKIYGFDSFLLLIDKCGKIIAY